MVRSLMGAQVIQTDVSFIADIPKRNAWSIGCFHVLQAPLVPQGPRIMLPPGAIKPHSEYQAMVPSSVSAQGKWKRKQRASRAVLLYKTWRYVHAAWLEVLSPKTGTFQFCSLFWDVRLSGPRRDLQYQCRALSSFLRHGNPFLKAQVQSLISSVAGVWSSRFSSQAKLYLPKKACFTSLAVNIEMYISYKSSSFNMPTRSMSLIQACTSH